MPSSSSWISSHGEGLSKVTSLWPFQFYWWIFPNHKNTQTNWAEKKLLYVYSVTPLPVHCLILSIFRNIPLSQLSGPALTTSATSTLINHGKIKLFVAFMLFIHHLQTAHQAGTSGVELYSGDWGTYTALYLPPSTGRTLLSAHWSLIGFILQLYVV